MVKINMGCGRRNFGTDWIHIDGGSYEHLDYHSITKLDFEDNSVDLIYASHLMEYFDRVEVVPILKEWQRVLKDSAILRLAVPNFKVLSSLYHSGAVGLVDIIGPLYGRMYMSHAWAWPTDTPEEVDELIFHKTAYDMEELSLLLNSAGFREIKKYDWRKTDHAQFDDHSQAYFPHMDKENGTLISLNIEGKKIP